MTDRRAADARDAEIARLQAANVTLTERRMCIRHALLKGLLGEPESGWDEGWNAASNTVIALIDAQDHGTLAAEIAEMRRTP